MLWIIGTAFLILGLVCGYLLGFKIFRDNLLTTNFKLERISKSDRALIMRLLRRDIANYLMREDPDRFLELYKGAYQCSKSVGDLSEEKRVAMLKEITDEFPYYEDFDVIARRDYVIEIPRVFGHPSHQELENHFLTLVRYQELLTTLLPPWKNAHPISEEDFDVAEEYVMEEKDRRVSR